MRVKCSHCGSLISSTAAKCPNCGAANGGTTQAPARVPKTLEELRQFCEAKGLPLSKMRFFIGEDYRQPKAFGIFQNEDGDFVVYKNKADGSRAIRYQGPDEAYAVNELYQKLKSEVALRKGSTVRAGSAPVEKGRRYLKWIFLGVVVLVVILFFTRVDTLPNRGYYRYDDTTYYNTSDGWYSYQAGSWIPVTVAGELYNDYGNYWQGSSYSDDYGVSDFNDSAYAETETESSWSDSSDSDWDYDYSSWDSGSTNWGSDW